MRTSLSFFFTPTENVRSTDRDLRTALDQTIGRARWEAEWDTTTTNTGDDDPGGGGD
jgi:hypothetical protein